MAMQFAPLALGIVRAHPIKTVFAGVAVAAVLFAAFQYTSARWEASRAESEAGKRVQAEAKQQQAEDRVVRQNERTELEAAKASEAAQNADATLARYYRQQLEEQQQRDRARRSRSTTITAPGQPAAPPVTVQEANTWVIKTLSSLQR